MANIEDISKAFRAALDEWTESHGRGEASRIAKGLGVSTSYISDLKTGHRQGNEEIRRAICLLIKYDYEKFLERGRQLLAGSPKKERSLQASKYLKDVRIILTALSKVDEIERSKNLHLTESEKHNLIADVIERVHESKEKEVSISLVEACFEIRGYLERNPNELRSRKRGIFKTVVGGDDPEPVGS